MGMIGELIDFEPKTELGKEIKRMIENGDHSDAHLYWIIDYFEKEIVGFQQEFWDLYQENKTQRGQIEWLEGANKRQEEVLKEIKHYAMTQDVIEPYQVLGRINAQLGEDDSQTEK